MLFLPASKRVSEVWKEDFRSIRIVLIVVPLSEFYLIIVTLLESVRYSRYTCEKTFRVRSLLPRMKLPSSYNFVTRAYFQNLKTLMNRSTLCDQMDISYIFQLCFAVKFYVVEIFKISPKMRLCSFRLCAMFLTLLERTIIQFKQQSRRAAEPQNLKIIIYNNSMNTA